MPSLTRWLNALNLTENNQGQGAIPTEDVKATVSNTYFLAPFLPHDPNSPAPLLHPVPPPSKRQVQPAGSIHFTLTYPLPPIAQAPTAFFFSCVPDPIGFLAQSASFIRSHLASSSSGPPSWRFAQIALTLEDEPGLAYTSDGKIHISLQWIGNVMRDVKEGGRPVHSATKEFKGVLLHELVHAIQYDGFGSTPTWLTESIADYVRLQAQLGPEHWRHPGQGNKERGWEDGYDAGAQFFAWLVGNTGVEVEDVQPDFPVSASQIPTPTPTSQSQFSAAPPQSTQYPTDPRPPGPAPEPKKGRRRPGPWPNLVKQLDSSLQHNQYSDRCWKDLTGQEGGLEYLWAAYLGHYSSLEFL